MIVNAAAMAMKNLLGLVCDPVAGLVEVPCVKRNVIGTVNAMSCADMTMAGIFSRIPPDQVIDAMGANPTEYYIEGSDNVFVFTDASNGYRLKVNYDSDNKMLTDIEISIIIQ